MKLEEINEKHSLENFSCETGSLDNYLKTRALSECKRLLSKTYVVSDNGNVVAFCTLVLHSLKPEQKELFLEKDEISKLRVPALLIGQLAVHKDFKGQGIGASLIQTAIKYALEINNYVHFPVIIVDAQKPELISYYKDKGFKKFTDNDSRLYLPIADIIKTFNETQWV